MKTTEEIDRAFAQVSDEDVYALAKTLEQHSHSGKPYIKLNVELLGDKYSAHQRMRVLLASAYDWFAYGN